MRKVPLVACALGLSACASFMRASLPERALPLEIGARGLHAPVTVRVDDMGIPFVEAADLDDLAFAMGFTAAHDRLGQMVSFKLMAQGRVGEMLGPPMLDMDRFMRALDLPRTARLMWTGTSPAGRRLLMRYADGVNAFIALGELPPDLALAGFKPDPWTPVDSLSVFALITFGLMDNLQEEIIALRLAQAVGVEKLAWLHPIYPDEPLPFDEAKKLAGIDLKAAGANLAGLEVALAQLRGFGVNATAASNDWVVHKSRTGTGASILADDTHLPISLPSIWHFLHARAPGYDAAGVAIAGVPGVVAGYNGHLAWGMTMVMGDTQDLFLEELKTVDGRLHYRHGDAWLPCVERVETFAFKGGKPVTETIWSTRHGPLLNRALRHQPQQMMVPPPVTTGYGLALQSVMFEPDSSFDAYVKLAQSQSVKEAAPLVRGIRAIPLNMVFADKDDIAWQVTGRYPVRAKGLGLFPSPGWTDEYDWTGFLDVGEQPSLVNPPQGFIATANNRSVPPPRSARLGSSWYAPERSEREAQILGGRTGHTAQDSRQMQLDQHSLFAEKLRAWLTGPKHQAAVVAAIARLPAAEAQRAKEAFSILASFDADLLPESRAAAVYGAFVHCAALRIFADELGPVDGELWQAFATLLDNNYGAVDDHLLYRGDESPFWDDVTTPQRETKADIFALAMADAVELLEARLGKERGAWSWGALHTYSFQTDASRLSASMSGPVRIALGAMSGYFDRGPFPAGGDHTTLNAAGYRVATDFDAWLIPEMRFIVDFSQDEPMVGINSTGQSGHPSSPHYDDGMQAWLKGDYRPFPFQAANIERQYLPAYRLVPRR